MKSEKVIETIKSIIESPRIHEYKFGITKNSVRRRNQYFNVDFEHFVIVDTGLKPNVALKMEQEIFTKLTKEAPKNSVTYKKYHSKTRDESTPESTGGYEPKEEDSYDLYIAWL